MAKFKVLATMKLHPDALRIVEEAAEVKVNPLERPYTEEELIEEVKSIDAVLLGLELFSARVIEGAGRLKVIGRVGVGYDNVDVATATRKRVFVTYTPEVLSETVADLAFGLILAAVRRIVECDRAVRSGEWSRLGSNVMWSRLMARDVYGKTLGIVGLGSIGSKVARRAKSFNMTILYHDSVRKGALERELGVKYVSLEELLGTSDIVTIHAPLTPATRGMMGKRQIALMKDGAYLVNTARGPIIDEDALHHALKEGKLAGAGLDVFSVEPLAPDNRLLEFNNVVFTPHMGSATHETRRLMVLTAAEDVVNVLRGKRPKYLVNPELLARMPLKA